MKERESTKEEGTPPGTLRVLLLGSEEQRREWSGMVWPIAQEVWQAFEEIPLGVQPDLVITETGAFPDPEVGVVRISGTDPADVHLPEEPSVHELHLACGLLGEIVRLRRQQRIALSQQQQWREAAYADPLTGLPNRRAWNKALVLWRQHSSREEVPSGMLVLAIFDLDDFKQVNEKFGHDVGDAVLKTAGSALIESLRQGDLVARLGGDEFGLLLEVPEGVWAAAVVERVRTTLPHRLHRVNLPVITASAGFTLLEAKGTSGDVSDYPRRADAALQQAKLQGKDKTVVFKEG